MFKYLPYPLKKYSKIESMEFSSSKKDSNNETYRRYDVEYYQNMINSKPKLVDEKVFKFIHL